MKHLLSGLHLNRHILYCLLTAGFLSACSMGEFKPQIEQKVRNSCIRDNETDIVTYVWYHGEIIWVAYDPIEKADSTLIAERYKQAEEIVKRIKACR